MAATVLDGKKLAETVRAEVATGEGTIAGLAVETDDRTGLATRIAAVRIGPHREESRPGVWE